MSDVVPAPAPVRIPVRGGGTFPVRRIYCVGRNFADHAKEMGAAVPASKADRGTPVFFCKPADAVVLDGVVPYPPGTHDLHHEVELVVALGADAQVFGYAIGLDLTRRDLQSAAKAKGLPWDTGKAFDHSAPVSEIVRFDAIGPLAPRTLSLAVNGQARQRSTLDQLIWDVPDILDELAKLFTLQAGDLVFMGTPAGVGPLVPGDAYEARLDDVLRLQGHVVPR
ncbi:fumarylacetoacetase [Lysobacter helvus]|uniref:Fumarylacetoacetase n=2 Tax=Lysobacteraceae TaxID=32033 RepID=A0ABN6FTG2_9GAMM|nr:MULTISPECIES: fumarylacetoacetate hydrolase family protein [Lysobacter]BCT92739.1 fumarylacetoacetase [Lysobacter caseinilyticus]BCT95892.1 fumarylacetoacetase [Lysobacter helvus]